MPLTSRRFRRASLALASVALAVSAAAGGALATASPAGEPRIIDGEVATSNPGAVVVLWRYEKEGKEMWWHQCAGSVVAPQWVLLAKHCILTRQENQLDRFVIRAGSLKDESGGETAQIGGIFKSPHSDVMLYKLRAPYSNAITPVTLATQDPPKGSVNTIYGWGGIDPSEMPQVSPDLKTATIVPYEFISRDNSGGPGIRSNRKSGVAWRADSGGPQFYNNTQVGIISTVGNDKSFMTSASVAKNLNWIRSTMASN